MSTWACLRCTQSLPVPFQPHSWHFQPERAGFTHRLRPCGTEGAGGSGTSSSTACSSVVEPREEVAVVRCPVKASCARLPRCEQVAADVVRPRGEASRFRSCPARLSTASSTCFARTLRPPLRYVRKHSGLRRLLLRRNRLGEDAQPIEMPWVLCKPKSDHARRCCMQP